MSQVPIEPCLFPQPPHEGAPILHFTGAEIPGPRDVRSGWWMEICCYGVLGLDAVGVLPRGSVRCVRSGIDDGSTFAFQGVSRERCI